MQPEYLRHLHRHPTEWLEQTYGTHAVFRASRGARLPAVQDDILSYLQAKYAAPGGSMAQLFDYVLPTDESSRAALAWYTCDLFLFVFYACNLFRPIQTCDANSGKLLVHLSGFTPFLMWSDLNLQCVTQTDVLAVFLTDPRTPDDVRLSIQALKDTSLPAVATASSQVVPAHL